MIRESDVKQKLEALQREELSLEAFENWLGPASWSMHGDSSPDAIELVSSIHVLLSERDDHILDEAKLRRELLSLINPQVIRISLSISVDGVSPISMREPVFSANLRRLPEILIPLQT